MRKAHRYGDKLVWPNGSVLNEEVGTANDCSDKKYYAIVAMCGHVGDGYFIPILFSVQAKNEENAKEYIKNTPRVKNQAKGCILAIKEISQIEDIFIKTINRHDSYLTYSSSRQVKDSRRILSYNAVKEAMNRFNKKTVNEILDMNSVCLELKVADDYTDGNVLQRYFAPKWEGEKIVYPKKVDMDLLLRDYYVSKTKSLGIQKGNAQILICFCKIFGKQNQFGIKIDEEKVSYKGEDGKRHTLEYDEFSKSTYAFDDSSRLVEAIRAKKSRSRATGYRHFHAKGKATSGMERFNSRMEKTKAKQCEIEK